MADAERTLSRTLAIVASFAKSSAALTSFVCQRITKTLTQPVSVLHIMKDGSSLLMSSTRLVHWASLAGGW